MSHAAPRTILPVAGWNIERAVEITGVGDPILPTSVPHRRDQRRRAGRDRPCRSGTTRRCGRRGSRSRWVSTDERVAICIIARPVLYSIVSTAQDKKGSYTGGCLETCFVPESQKQ